MIIKKEGRRHLICAVVVSICACECIFLIRYKWIRMKFSRCSGFPFLHSLTACINSMLVSSVENTLLATYYYTVVCVHFPLQQVPVYCMVCWFFTFCAWAKVTLNAWEMHAKNPIEIRMLPAIAIAWHSLYYIPPSYNLRSRRVFIARSCLWSIAI